MAGFDASTAVDELTYDFTKFVEGAKGRIEEPSDNQITSYRKTLAELIKETSVDEQGKVVGDVDDGASSLDQVNALCSMMGRDQSAEMDKLTQAVSDLCSGNPSYEQLKQLPHRVRQAFFGWVTGEMVRPEGVLSVMNQ